MSVIEDDDNEYIERHKVDQKLFLDELTIFIKKHMNTLCEEQYFGVYNESILSDTIYTQEELNKRYSGGVDIFNVFCRLADNLGYPVPDEMSDIDWV